MIIIFVFLILSIESKDYNYNLSIEELFQEFKKDFKKEYKTETEEMKRKLVFEKNIQKIKEFNSQEHLYKIGINKFADYDDNELISSMENKKLSIKKINEDIQILKTQHLKKASNLPKNFTLCGSESEYNFCGNLNIDQGSCGCCYAAATSHYLSMMYTYLTYEKNNNQPKRKLISTQQMIDCNKNWGGCGGGLAEFVLESVDSFYLDEDYPFVDNYLECSTPENCKIYKHECKTLNKPKPLTFKNLKKKYLYFYDATWEEMKEIIHTYKGFITNMKVETSLMRYVGGIYKDEKCQNQVTDHVVVVDGYGECGDIKYLWVRNTWGNNWGIENGHFKIDFNTLCGINSRDYYGKIEGKDFYLPTNLIVELMLTDDDSQVIYNPNDGKGDDNPDEYSCMFNPSEQSNKSIKTVILSILILIFFFL